jgi:hypothetical protein
MIHPDDYAKMAAMQLISCEVFAAYTSPWKSQGGHLFYAISIARNTGKPLRAIY